MNLLIVDDEPLARAELLRLFAELLPGFRGTEAATLSEARSAMLRDSFDGIFVDMEMGGTCGLELLPDAKVTDTPVVITTAHERFAVNAFEGEVLDYLLKPVEQNRLFRAIARISRHRERSGGDFIILTDQLHCWPVDPAKIPMIEAEGSYCVVHFQDRKPLTVSRSLKEIEQMLGGHAFIRANRSQIINLHHIEVVHRPGMGRMVADVKGHGEIEFSRRQAQAFRLKFAI